MPRRRTLTSAEVKTSLYLPEPLWRAVKDYGLDRKLSLRAIITQALVRFLPNVKGGPQS